MKSTYSTCAIFWKTFFPGLNTFRQIFIRSMHQKLIYQGTQKKWYIVFVSCDKSAIQNGVNCSCHDLSWRSDGNCHFDGETCRPHQLNDTISKSVAYFDSMAGRLSSHGKRSNHVHDNPWRARCREHVLGL